MSELLHSYCMLERDLEYTEIEFEEVPLKLYDPDSGDIVDTDSLFSGIARIDEDGRLDWINIGVECTPHRYRVLYDGLKDGVLANITPEFDDWIRTLPVDYPDERERDRSYYHAQVL